MAFFKGGVSYSEIQGMPIPELLRIQKQAVRINDERQREMGRRR